LTNWKLIAMTTSFTLMLSIITHSYAFHENLGIDDNKASELYHTNPNDPAIVRWKNALQSAITGMDWCFTIGSAISCQPLMGTIISNCKSHPNTLLACNDSRFPTYPSILRQALQAQEKAEEEEKKAIASKIPMYALSIIDKCFSNPNSNTTFEVASPACDEELRSLQTDCQLTSPAYDFCKDERFVGYLEKNGIPNSSGIVNSTVSSYSNLTGNSSSSNSTSP
jgi:hypothetical protein